MVGASVAEPDVAVDGPASATGFATRLERLVDAATGLFVTVMALASVLASAVGGGDPPEIGAARSGAAGICTSVSRTPALISVASGDPVASAGPMTWAAAATSAALVAMATREDLVTLVALAVPVGLP